MAFFISIVLLARVGVFILISCLVAGLLARSLARVFFLDFCLTVLSLALFDFSSLLFFSVSVPFIMSSAMTARLVFRTCSHLHGAFSCIGQFPCVIHSHDGRALHVICVYEE